MPWEGMLGKCWNGCAMCWLFVQGWARALRACGCLHPRGLKEGGVRACGTRAAVRCGDCWEAGRRGFAAGRACASCAMGLRIFFTFIYSEYSSSGRRVA